MPFCPQRLALAIALLSSSAVAPLALASDISLDTPSTSALNLSASDTLAVKPAASLTTAKVAVTLKGGTSGPGVVIDNAGSLISTGGRAIDSSGSASGERNYSIFNRSGATIQGSNDALRIDTHFSSGSVLIDNSGTIRSTDSGQAIDLDAVRSHDVKTTLINREGGLIRGEFSDGMKTGSNATILNYGEISTGDALNDDNKFDGVDIDSATGVTVTNYGTLSGGRHGITTDLGATLINYGDVTGRNGSGFDSDGDGTVINHGTITGAYSGLKPNGDGDGVDIDLIAHIENYGVIQGTGAGGVDKNGFANGSDYGVKFEVPGSLRAEATRVMGSFLRDVMKNSLGASNFRLFGPDETASNRLDAVYEVSAKAWMEPLEPDDLNLAADGRVMEILSEQVCEGWLEGYLLTGRHGLLSCYEAFIHIVDSMVNQHAKWLKTAAEVPWRKPVASLNFLLTSHVWRQDHNGFSHQDPGFIDLVANKKSDVARIYLPPDANCLLSVADHCLRSRNYINVIVAGKQPEWQWLDIDAAISHCQTGIGRWDWACRDDQDPDVVMACAGDVPTLETLAAVTLLREYVPDLRVRVVNVVDLMVLQPSFQHPHGLSDSAFDELFTVDKPVIFAFHGYPALIHRLLYKRNNHENFHVRGFKEEGATTTPFDMAVINNLDRYQLALDVIERVPRLHDQLQTARSRYWSIMEKHKLYLIEHGQDMPEVLNWQWTPVAGR